MRDDTSAHLRWRHGFAAFFIANVAATLVAHAIAIFIPYYINQNQGIPEGYLLLLIFLSFAMTLVLPGLVFIILMLPHPPTLYRGVIWGIANVLILMTFAIYSDWYAYKVQDPRFGSVFWSWQTAFQPHHLLYIPTGLAAALAGWAYLKYIWSRKMRLLTIDLQALE